MAEKSQQHASPRKSRLAWEVTVVLAAKVILLYLIWAAWFSQPIATHMQVPAGDVVQRVLAPGPAAKEDSTQSPVAPTQPPAPAR